MIAPLGWQVPGNHWGGDCGGGDWTPRRPFSWSWQTVDNHSPIGFNLGTCRPGAPSPWAGRQSGQTRVM
ncbi:hypothetical protein ANANG_G00241270 [Anguilla anguilla]|uniref:Uncharacterized protein n=1 Tax=Anguilla anguilla TaxID=7936 RepID=A0A9D3LV53_ANGAN|nr:hypothetical protein ANANG_G00241270 [Anguilla anguilla]